LLAFIDADVFVDQNWLSSLAKLFEHPYIGGGQGRIIPCDHDGQKLLNEFRIRQQNDSTGGSNIILRLMYGESPMVNSAACMYRRDAFLFVGGFDVWLERHEDIDLAKRVFVAGFDLIAASQAVAFVEYHGEGWWSYFKRSFDEGTTKQSYNEKWTKYFSYMNRKEIELDNMKPGLRKNFRFLANWRMNYDLIKYEIIFNFLRTVRYRDFYYFLKAINTSFRAIGRLCGKWSYGYDYPYEPCFHQEALYQHIVMKDGSSVKLDHHMRFVMQDGQLLYAMNIKNNQFINFSESAWLGELIKYRSRIKS
jgi:GT2 family glycosyltransferase